MAFEHVDCLPDHDRGFVPALAALLPHAKARCCSCQVLRHVLLSGVQGLVQSQLDRLLSGVCQAWWLTLPASAESRQCK